jgi:prefoldin subunit 5
VSREEYIERLDEECDILERRLRHLKAELEELRAEGRGAQ